jgi:hypothetical protein
MRNGFENRQKLPTLADKKRVRIAQRRAASAKSETAKTP